MNKIKLGINSKVNIKWKVSPFDYNKNEVDNIRVKFAEKYGIDRNNVEVEPIFIKNTGSDDAFIANEVENVQDPIAQQSLFKPFLEERGVVDYNYDKLIEIDDLINNSINYESYDKHKRYTIKWIKWDNFMSYGGNNFVDFTNLKGLVLLTSEPANQGGKTTFCLDLLRFLLFGKVTSRESDWTLSKVFNKHLPEATEVVVEGCITIDNEDYIIKRVVSRPDIKKRTEKSKVSQKVNYYHLVNGEYVDLEDEGSENLMGSSTRETNKVIKDAIGNERDFDLMICVNSDNLKGLISLKDTERGRLITRWIGLLPLEEKDKIARETFNKSIMPKLMLNRYNKEDLRVQNEELQQKYDELAKEGKDIADKVKKSEEKIKEFNEKKEIYLQSKREVDDNLLKYDKHTLEMKKSELQGNLLKKQIDLKENNEKYALIKDCNFDEKEYKDLITLDKEISIELNTKRAELVKLKNEIEVLKKGEFCPTCGARLANVDNSAAISEKENMVNELTIYGINKKNELNELSEKILKLEDDRIKYNEKNKTDLLIQKISVDLENITSQIKECDRILNEMKKNEEYIKKNNDIDVQINLLKANISEEEKVKNLNEEWLEEARVTLKTTKRTIAANVEIIATIEKEEEIVRDWKIYLEMVGKNGISKMVLRNALPLINGEMKRLLSNVCDFDVEVVIDEHNDVAFYLLHDGVRSNLASGSGFEQTVASLALRSVLGKISTFSKPSFVVFDEILGGVADENYDAIKVLYDKIAKEYQMILQITHLKQISEWHTSTMVVRKENNISRIETC